MILFQAYEFIDKAKSGLQIGPEEYYRFFSRLGLKEKIGENYHTTGFGNLLFCEAPDFRYHHAMIKATFIKNGKVNIAYITGSLLQQVERVENWFKSHIQSVVCQDNCPPFACQFYFTIYKRYFQSFRKLLLPGCHKFQFHKIYDAQCLIIQNNIVCFLYYNLPIFG